MDKCPLCKMRLNEWQMFSDKTTFVGNTLCHNECLQDYKLRYGKNYESSGLPSDHVWIPRLGEK